MQKLFQLAPVETDYGLIVDNQRGDRHAAGFVNHFLSGAEVFRHIKLLIPHSFFGKKLFHLNTGRSGGGTVNNNFGRHIHHAPFILYLLSYLLSALC